MGEIKNRSVRLDDENYAWLQGLPGRSLNEAVERLRLGGTENGPKAGELTPVTGELLDLVRSLPDTADIERVVRVVMAEAHSPGRNARVLPAVDDVFEEEPVVRDNRPKNCRCVHCGGRFAGPKWSTICGECKSSGHTNQPAECPRCTEGSAI